MGNFSGLLQRIRSADKELAKKIANVYENEHAYKAFCEDVKNMAEALKEDFHFKINLIAPAYGAFYNPYIYYE